MTTRIYYTELYRTTFQATVVSSSPTPSWALSERYNSAMDRRELDVAVRELVDDYRVQCLWFLREDYYPTTDAERAHVLDLIERHGTVEAFRRAAPLRAWLSQSSSDTRSVF